MKLYGQRGEKVRARPGKTSALWSVDANIAFSRAFLRTRDHNRAAQKKASKFPQKTQQIKCIHPSRSSYLVDRKYRQSLKWMTRRRDLPLWAGLNDIGPTSRTLTVECWLSTYDGSNNHTQNTHFTHPIICQFYMAVGVHQNIVQFEIAINNIWKQSGTPIATWQAWIHLAASHTGQQK